MRKIRSYSSLKFWNLKGKHCVGRNWLTHIKERERKRRRSNCGSWVEDWKKYYDNKHHNSIFFSNPQLLVKKTMKSDVSWKVNKSYVELWNVLSFTFTIVRTVWQNRSIPMGWSVSTQSTSWPLSWLIWVLSFQFLQIIFIILAFTSRLFVCVVFVFIPFFGSAADISNRWRCTDICAKAHLIGQFEFAATSKLFLLF